MRGSTIDNPSTPFNMAKPKEPPTPPYSIMLKTPGLHTRSNSYSFDNVYDPGACRPRAYSSSVFDFGYVPPAKPAPVQTPIASRMPATPTQRTVLLDPGHVTPPETSPHPAGSDWLSPHTPSGLHHPNAHAIQHSPSESLPMGQVLFGSQLSPGSQTGALGSPAQIYNLCKNQKGCRILQYKLQEGDHATINTIFDATRPHMVSLMSDPFGNYFCQKLMEQCSPEQLTGIIKTIHPKIVEIALGQHGTRALQKIVEQISTQEQVALMATALQGSVVRIIRDINGNHVIQKCLVELGDDGAQFIYDSVFSNIIAVGTHRHGCCVLQRCLDNSSATNKHMLVSQIIANSLDLVRDPFGNYVCQYVVDLKIPEYTHAMISQLLGHLIELSMQKFSSNVVEKCLRTASEHQNSYMIQELMLRQNLQRLLLDPYGNYVIQTALESSLGTMRTLAFETVQQNLHTIRTPYGRRITSKLKTLSQEHSG